MDYLLLIVEPRGQRSSRAPQEGRDLYEQMVQFGKGLAARGMLKASNSLQSDRRGVRVRKRDGQDILIDGPFAEAKEMIGGFFLVDCANREEAVAIARECPAAEWATVEVREAGPCYED